MTHSVVYKATDLNKVGDGTYEYIASDETVDSYGDIVRASGWDLKRYRQNPIVLFGHDKANPVGTSTKQWIENKKLMIRVKFADEGTSPFIDTLRKLVEQKIVRAISVGFLPTVQPNYLRDKNDMITGMEFIGQELLENSLVTVPANPSALQVARSMGVSEQHMQRVFAPRPTGASAHLGMQRAVLEMTKLGASGKR